MTFEVEFETWVDLYGSKDDFPEQVEVSVLAEVETGEDGIESVNVLSVLSGEQEIPLTSLTLRGIQMLHGLAEEVYYSQAIYEAEAADERRYESMLEDYND